MATSTYTPLATTTLASAASSYTFSSIPATYTDLVIVANYAGFSATGATTLIQLNGDATTTRYSSTNVEGDGTSATSGRYNNATAQAGMLLGGGNLGYGTGQAIEVFHIMNYSNATTYKTVLSRFSQPATMVQANVGLYTQTTAISSVTILTYGGKTFSIGSTFSLYGISAAPSAKATGGMITSDATYYYHTFLSSGTFTPTQSLSADILTIAGGGGGGGSYAGGGGAGGLLGFTSQSLTATGYTITVGAGGSGGAQNVTGTTGSDSQFSGLTLVKGGGAGGNGGASTTNIGLNGGSGGGAGRNAFLTPSDAAGGSATSGQGNAGGTYLNSTSGNVGCGGGGAGGAGAAQQSAGIIAGYGGVGSSAYSSWGSATSTGQNVSSTYYYAGGGGGGAYTASAAAGAGGYGGGAAGGYGVSGASATASTGGGGGGGGGNTSYAGGAGGSGIVIVRYAK